MSLFIIFLLLKLIVLVETDGIINNIGKEKYIVEIFVEKTLKI